MSPPVMYKRPSSLASSSVFGIVTIFNFSYPIRCGIIFHDGFNFVSLMASGDKLLLSILLFH